MGGGLIRKQALYIARHMYKMWSETSHMAGDGVSAHLISQPKDV